MTQYIDTAVESPKLRAPDPQPVVMRDVKFLVISKENIHKYIEDIESGDLVIFGVTDQGYQNLSINTLQLLNYIKAQRNVIGAYREYYE